jgi:putative membrane protein
MNWESLPAMNASLNTISAVFLGLGYYFIRQGNRIAHRNCMVTAFTASALFLIGYLSYHTYVAYHLGRGPTIFREPAWFRPVYLGILLTHTVLAAVIVPLVLRSLYLAAKERFEAHKRIARWTWPLWMYVSVTGVLIYLLLYQIFPQTPPPAVG